MNTVEHETVTIEAKDNVLTISFELELSNLFTSCATVTSKLDDYIDLPEDIAKGVYNEAPSLTINSFDCIDDQTDVTVETYVAVTSHCLTRYHELKKSYLIKK